ncbi:MAG: glycosyltransferase family 2 protein [Magnetococcus sp. WYHC-3]
MVEISVVVPIYNGEPCLQELVCQITKALRNHPHELIFVEDQSTDDSWGEIQRLCKTEPNLVGIRLRKNAGQDSAILCGLRQARGRFCVILDDDLQHDPQDILTLYAQCQKNDLDVCYAHFPARKHSWWKRAGSWLNGKLAEIVIAKPKHLYLSPFKIMRQEIATEIIKYTGAFPYVDGLILAVTHNIGQVEVTHHARYKGESTYGMAKSLVVFMRVATGFSVWPLRLSTCIGMVCSMGAFALALFYLAQYARNGHRVEGWITIVILQLLLGGLGLVSVGMVGEYLGRLYLNSNGKPQATIKEVCGGSNLRGRGTTHDPL